MHLVITIDGEELIARDCQHARIAADEHAVEFADGGNAVHLSVHHQHKSKGDDGDDKIVTDTQGITLPHHRDEG